MITAKIKFGILLCCLSMRFVMFSLVFLVLRIVFFVFSIIFGKTSLLFLLPVLSIIRCELCSVLTHCDVPYCVMRTAILLFVFRIVFFQIRVFREIGRYGLVRVINCDLSQPGKRTQTTFRFRTEFRNLQAVWKPFEKNLHPFERLIHPFGRNVQPFERLGHPFEKISIHSNDLVTRLIKTSNCSNSNDPIAGNSHPF